MSVKRCNAVEITLCQFILTNISKSHLLGKLYLSCTCFNSATLPAARVHMRGPAHVHPCLERRELIGRTAGWLTGVWSTWKSVAYGAYQAERCGLWNGVKNSETSRWIPLYPSLRLSLETRRTIALDIFLQGNHLWMTSFFAGTLADILAFHSPNAAVAWKGRMTVWLCFIPHRNAFLSFSRPVCFGPAMVDSNAMRKTFVVPDIKPLDQYDETRARICASVGWLLAKSYGNAGI